MTLGNATVASVMLALGAVCASPEAQATVIVNAVVGGAPTGVSYVNFDDLPLGSAGGTSGGVAVSFSGDGGVVMGAAPGINAAPFLSNNNGVSFGDPSNGADATRYITTGIGQLTLTMPEQVMYVGLLWGSVDAYNTLQLFDGPTLAGTISGADVAANADGNQGAAGTYYVNISSSLSFNRVVATSTQYGFEIDNVAYDPAPVSISRRAAAVPEPAALSLLGAGLVGIGMARRRRRKAAGPSRVSVP